ncbi:hypothetical protein DFJ73DRAFT_768138 [Zopfochytrium polystomum]|nr:hypothetical protein DFJ73DRAFT_768138 [Zopfochytrium polystomum]
MDSIPSCGRRLLLILYAFLVLATVCPKAVPVALGVPQGKPPLPPGARGKALSAKLQESIARHEFYARPEFTGGSPVIDTKFGGPVNTNKLRKAANNLPGTSGNHDKPDANTGLKSSKKGKPKGCFGACARKAAGALRAGAKAGVQAAGKTLKTVGKIAMGPGNTAASKRGKR